MCHSTNATNLDTNHIYPGRDARAPQHKPPVYLDTIFCWHIIHSTIITKRWRITEASWSAVCTCRNLDNAGLRINDNDVNDGGIVFADDNGGDCYPPPAAMLPSLLYLDWLAAAIASAATDLSPWDNNNDNNNDNNEDDDNNDDGYGNGNDDDDNNDDNEDDDDDNNNDKGWAVTRIVVASWRLTAHWARLTANNVGPLLAPATTALPTDKPKTIPLRRLMLARRLPPCRVVLAALPQPVRPSSTLAPITVVPSLPSLL